VGSVVGAAVGAALVLAGGPALADHPGGLRAPDSSPFGSALLYGGLALLVGLVVVAIVALFTRRTSGQ
jgi:hypothetical protein